MPVWAIVVLIILAVLLVAFIALAIYANKLVIDHTPRALRGAKVPVVKAKIGPKVTNLMCDEKIFDLIPVKKEVKAVMNGIYIMDVKGLRGGLEQKPEKQGLLKRMRAKLQKKAEQTKNPTRKIKPKRKIKKGIASSLISPGLRCFFLPYYSK